MTCRIDPDQAQAILYDWLALHPDARLYEAARTIAITPSHLTRLLSGDRFLTADLLVTLWHAEPRLRPEIETCLFGATLNHNDL